MPRSCPGVGISNCWPQAAACRPTTSPTAIKDRRNRKSLIDLDPQLARQGKPGTVILVVTQVGGQSHGCLPYEGHRVKVPLILILGNASMPKRCLLLQQHKGANSLVGNRFVQVKQQAGNGRIGGQLWRVDRDVSQGHQLPG